jgi:hypothetical protein
LGAFLFAPAAGVSNRISFAQRPSANIPSQESIPLRLVSSYEPTALEQSSSTRSSAAKPQLPSPGFIDAALNPSIEDELSPDAGETFDYVIIVPDMPFVTSMNPLKAWKEQIGFHVKVVTLTDILGLYPTKIDNAERIWYFLHDRYLPLDWGIRYVLLVGDIDRIPMRYLFPDGASLSGNGYGTDYYYANLDVSAWDLDNDSRWGEFTQDQLDLHAEVLVGRLPFNNPSTLLAISNQIVAYEQAIGSWKRQGLLVHGIMDYPSRTSKTDMALLAEMLRADFFTPYGWTTTRLYEGEGISPSTYVSDTRINQSNYENRLGINRHGVINIAMHGARNSMVSNVWAVDADNDNQWDSTPPTSEVAISLVTDASRIITFPTNAFVFLLGCETARVIPDDTKFFSSTMQSRYLVSLTESGLTVKEYLEHGSPAVIGSTAGEDYHPLWSNTSQWGVQTLNYMFYQNLIQEDMALGDSFFAAMEEYSRHIMLQRGIRVFNYFGDPSLLQKGIEARPGGTDTLVAEGAYKVLAADYDANGDMYVGVVVDNPAGTSSSINIYRSTNHGQNWTGWTYVDIPAPASLVRDLSLQVGRLTTGTPYIHVFFAVEDGRVYDTRLDLGNPDNRSALQLADLEKLPRFLSTTRTPGSGLSSMYIYAAWEYAYVSDSEPAVVIFRSGDNGATWVRMAGWDGREQPSIDAGPSGSVYVAAVEDNPTGDVVALRSSDSAVTWSIPIVLAAADGALHHTAPDVAVSTDPAYPAVWVAYEYDFQDPVWGSSKDLRFAYSSNNGANWEINRGLAADIGRDEWIPDIAGLRTAANRWVNLAYNLDAATAAGNERQVIWRYTSGGMPNYWNPRRIVNDFPGGAPSAIGPVVVFSPGSSISGSGVVYGGANKQNVYFSAPWLTEGGKSPEIAAGRLSSPEPLSSSESLRALSLVDASSPQIEEPAAPAVSSGMPLFWQPLAHIPDASAIGGITFGSDGALYAAAVLDTPYTGPGSGHVARVYRSSNLGESWTPTAAFDNSWSVSSLIRTQANTLLASGMALNWSSASPGAVHAPAGATPSGVIYRSTNNGTSWSTVNSTANMAVYRLEQVSNGAIFAGSGWSGKLLVSTTDGQTWNQLADFGAGATVHDILRTGEPRLVVALEKPTGGEIWWTLNSSLGWTKATGLTGVESVNDLLEVDGALYAATRSASGGQVFRSDLSASSWSNPFTVSPAVTSITRLYLGAHGQILAGAENANGASETTVFRLNAGSNSWTPYNGWMDMATSVYDLLSTDQGLFATTGHLYGNLFRIRPDNLYWLYLPTIKR